MSANPSLDKCPSCGAQFPSGETCRERFEYCLTLDYEQPESYGAVHHLVVACYMLQHNEYTRRGWLEARALVADAIHHGTAPTELRKRNRQRFDSSQREWKLTLGEKMAGVDSIQWTRTIADIRLDSAEAYAETVRLWAQAVLADTADI
jgi:hypothetical protein